LRGVDFSWNISSYEKQFFSTADMPLSLTMVCAIADDASSHTDSGM
jgi:hypothetical protein